MIAAAFSVLANTPFVHLCWYGRHAQTPRQCRRHHDGGERACTYPDGKQAASRILKPSQRVETGEIKYFAAAASGGKLCLVFALIDRSLSLLSLNLSVFVELKHPQPPQRHLKMSWSDSRFGVAGRVFCERAPSSMNLQPNPCGKRNLATHTHTGLAEAVALPPPPPLCLWVSL